MLLSLANSPSKVGPLILLDHHSTQNWSAQAEYYSEFMLRVSCDLVGFSYCIQLVNRRLEVHCNSSNDTLKKLLYLAFHSLFCRAHPRKNAVFFDVFFFFFSNKNVLHLNPPFPAIRRPCALQTASWLDIWKLFDMVWHVSINIIHNLKTLEVYLTPGRESISHLDFFLKNHKNSSQVPFGRGICWVTCCNLEV